MGEGLIDTNTVPVQCRITPTTALLDQPDPNLVSYPIVFVSISMTLLVQSRTAGTCWKQISNS